LKVRIFFIVIVFAVFSFLILSVIPSAIITVRQSYALLQVAGNIIVETMPGETETFTWGLISEKNGSSTVNITADGMGAEYLSFPENITLAAGGQITYVPVNVSIPSNYTGPTELTPSILATEAGEEIGQTIINVAMSKTLCVIVGSQNNATTIANQNVTGLELKDYTQEVVIIGDNSTGSNQSIITIPIKSTSENITEFSLNQTRNEISFRASGEAGTNGTTIIYLDQILQEPYSLMVDRTPSTDFDIITNSTTGERGIQITYRHHCMDNNILLTGSEEVAATTTSIASPSLG
jgi:hypothetical protein